MISIDARELFLKVAWCDGNFLDTKQIAKNLKDVTNHITPLSAKSGIYSMYTTSDAANLGFGNMDATHEMAMTLYFAITFFSHPKLIWMPLPKRPPNGMILGTVMLAIITSIFGCYVFRFYGYVTSRVCNYP